MKARIRISPSSASVCTSASSARESDLDDLAGLAHAHPDQRPAPGEHVDLAGELAGPWRATSVSPAPDGRDDLDLAGGDHEERHDVLAGLDEHLAPLDRARRPCAATRAICAGVRIGNTWSARAVADSGEVVSDMASFQPLGQSSPHYPSDPVPTKVVAKNFWS